MRWKLPSKPLPLWDSFIIYSFKLQTRVSKIADMMHNCNKTMPVIFMLVVCVFFIFQYISTQICVEIGQNFHGKCCFWCNKNVFNRINFLIQVDCWTIMSFWFLAEFSKQHLFFLPLNFPFVNEACISYRDFM